MNPILSPLPPMPQSRRPPGSRRSLHEAGRRPERGRVEGLVRRSSVVSVRRTAGEGGFTILEVMIASTIILLVLVGLLSSLAKSQQLKATTAEYQTALEAARQKFEEIQSTTFSTIAATYNVAPGNSFAVTGLIHESRQTLTGIVNYSIPGRTNVGRVTVDSTNTDLLLVTIDLQWIGVMSNIQGAIAQPQSYTLVSQIADRNK